MIPKCCPWAGRLFVLAVLGLGLGLLAGCACGSCDNGSAAASEEAAAEQSAVDGGPEDCCLSKAKPVFVGGEGECPDAKNCEKCPLCEGDKAKATVKESEKEKEKAPVANPK